MRFTEYLIEADEFARQDTDSTDRIYELKRIVNLAHSSLMRIMDKWNMLVKNGFISRKNPTKGGTWVRVPKTMALDGDWYLTIDLKEPQAQKLNNYMTELAERESRVISKGRSAGEELQALEREHAMKIDTPTKNALNSVKK